MEKQIVSNSKANFNYSIEERYEAGIVLKGQEVKSIREGKISIKESHVKVIKGEIFIIGMHISQYSYGREKLDETRTRKLLMQRKEIKKILGNTTIKGYTLVPISVYLKGGLIKVCIALAKGKKLHDKRNDIIKKEQLREIGKQFKKHSHQQ